VAVHADGTFGAGDLVLDLGMLEAAADRGEGEDRLGGFEGRELLDQLEGRFDFDQRAGFLLRGGRPRRVRGGCHLLRRLEPFLLGDRAGVLLLQGDVDRQQDAADDDDDPGLAVVHVNVGKGSAGRQASGPAGRWG